MNETVLREEQQSVQNFELDPPVARRRRVGMVTYTLIAINVAVFLAMLASGLPFMSPDAQQVLPWGADFGPLTTSGQWWRLLTSCFLHFGIVHIAMNMYILFQIGPFTEVIFGRARFLFLYILAGLGGNIAGLYIHPFTVGAGASGAIFGVYGAVLAFLLVRRGVIPAAAASSILRSAGIFIVYNFFYGIRSEGTDLTAHIGGLVTGFLVGCAMAWTLAATSRSARTSRTGIASFASVAMLLLAIIFLPKSDTAQADWYRSILISPHITVNDNDIVVYAGEITKDQATRMGQTLVDIGFFGRKDIEVLLNKDATGPSLSIEFTGDETRPAIRKGSTSKIVDGKVVIVPYSEAVAPLPWDDPGMIATMHAVGTRIASVVGGPPFTIRILNRDGKLERAVKIQ